MSGKWDSAGSGQWGYWPGAFSPRAPWHKDKKDKKWKGRDGKDGKDGQKEDSLFPAYDNKKGGTAKVKMQTGEELVTVLATTRTSDTIVKDLQKLLNCARKAENKLAKIHADRAEKMQQWKDWEQQLKRCYATERQRHVSNLARLDKELEEAREQQELARQEVRQMAAGQAASPMEVVPTEDVDAQFAALMEEEDVSPGEESANEDVLRRALQASLEFPSTPPTMRSLPRTPVPKPVQKPAPLMVTAQASGSRLQPFPPPKPMQTGPYPVQDLNPMPSPHAVADPYQGVLLQQGGLQMGHAPAISPPVIRPKTKSRTPLKDSAKPTGPLGRHLVIHSPNKLEEKRSAAMQQIAMSSLPTGLGETKDTKGPHDAGRGGTITMPVETVLQDDDHSDETATHQAAGAELD